MKKFIVTVAEHHAVRYVVNAETQEEAQETILSGEFNEEDQLDDEIVSSDVVLVVEQD